MVKERRERSTKVAAEKLADSETKSLGKEETHRAAYGRRLRGSERRSTTTSPESITPRIYNEMAWRIQLFEIPMWTAEEMTADYLAHCGFMAAATGEVMGEDGIEVALQQADSDMRPLLEEAATRSLGQQGWVWEIFCREAMALIPRAAGLARTREEVEEKVRRCLTRWRKDRSRLGEVRMRAVELTAHERAFVETAFVASWYAYRERVGEQ